MARKRLSQGFWLSFVLLMASGAPPVAGASTGAEETGATPERPGDEPAPPRRILRSSLAGRWYDADPERLTAEIDGYLRDVKGNPQPGARALVLPHAGYRWSGDVAAYGIRQIARRTISRVIVIGPTHHRMGMENVASVPSATHYATPLGDVELDGDFLTSLRRYPWFCSNPEAHDQEHSVQIQVPLLQRALGQFRLVPIVVGHLDLETARRMAKILLGLMDRNTLVIASSDFTHYGPNYRYVPFREGIAENLKNLDMRAFGAIEKRSAADFAKFLADTGATVCGRDAVKILLAMLASNGDVKLLKYDTSGRKSGDYSNSVSYLSIAVRVDWPVTEPVAVPPTAGPLIAEDRARLLKLARGTLRFALEKRRFPTPEDVGLEKTSALKEPRGAFVTLQKEGRLRGCTGRIYPCFPLFKTVMIQSVNSALRDSRFPPVELSEISELRLEISVLEQPRPVPSYRDIVLGKHGIVLEKDGHRAVYLPQVAPEQGWDLEETLTNLSRKARLPPDAWKDGASFTVFEAEVFGEEKE